MKIVEKLENLVCVKDVPLSGIFKFNDKIYLKTEDFYYESNTDSGDACAIDLHEGAIMEFHPTEKVAYYPNAELHLNGVM